jgi:plastocyanin
MTIVALMAACVTGTGAARAATVSGTISGGPPPVVDNTPDTYGKFRRGAAPENLPAPHPLIVILVPVGKRATPARPAGNPVMDQRNERFVPRAIAVRTGTTVDFLNSDSFYHNVFSLSAPRKFDLGRYKKGVSRSVTFSKPGLVKLFCDIHPNMIGYILVTDSAWFGSMTPGGKYAIENVPAGTYSVTVWHERLKEPVELTTVDVTGGDAVELNLTVPS